MDTGLTSTSYMAQKSHYYADNYESSSLTMYFRFKLLIYFPSNLLFADTHVDKVLNGIKRASKTFVTIYIHIYIYRMQCNAPFNAFNAASNIHMLSSIVQFLITYHSCSCILYSILISSYNIHTWVKQAQCSKIAPVANAFLLDYEFGWISSFKRPNS